MALQFAVVNGPNLNRLGKRENHHYGSQTWNSIFKELEMFGRAHDISLEAFQSNSEGALIDYLQEVEFRVQGILFNPGAYAHTSIALRDCVASLSVPVVEVHLSKIGKRESFRTHSYIAEVAEGYIVGFGAFGYSLGLKLLHDHFKQG
ncbi:MAG: type II 3-dehydroquinate dehydratase [Deltaproteobacteria bacterium]|nr:type II 3-dehydroquinate dehydratase [Deltaproteobacteria bacterium]